MSNSTRLPHIIAYDIADPKRLQRVHKYLKKRAIPLQYSVFLGFLNVRQRDRLLQGLADIINHKEDDIRVYPLPRQPEWSVYGKALWQEGIVLTGVALPEQG